MMARRKKAFTLIELLAVIVIIGIISLITVPAIMDIINKRAEDAYAKQEALIIEAAKEYRLLYKNKINWVNDVATIYLRDLQDKGLLKEPLKDPRGGDFDNSKPGGYRVVITKYENNYDYNLVIADGGLDVTKPVIKLLGNNPTHVYTGQTYIDPGATAIDDMDGDITGSIVATGSVDTNVPGTYSITYNVIDSAGILLIQW